MSSEREAKQQFLRQEILDKGLSASAFMEKCEREKGSDVDSWTMEELRAAVLDFQKEAADEDKTQRLSNLRAGTKASSLFPEANASFAGSEIAVAEGPGDQLYTVSCQTLSDTDLSTVSGVSVLVLE
jgi:hypothetical protein